MNAAPLVVSVDVEDWPQSTWDHSLEITPRAARNAERVLDLLAANGRTATMFVLGKLAARFPETVRRMARDGHEVASHGYGHIEVFHQNPAEFREDVRRAKDLLEELIDAPVVGYRAPDFSIIPSTLWALEILAEEGHRYDSSVVPVRMSRYGIDGWPTEPVRVGLPSGLELVELPLATVRLLGRRWLVAGGGYHRLLPWPAIRWAARRRLRRDEPFMAYCHPYEFDAGEFAALDLAIPFKTRLHQGLGRHGFQAKFERLLTGFPLLQARQLALEHRWPIYPLEAGQRSPEAPESPFPLPVRRGRGNGKSRAA
jgi:polysaccharide deacetylase family protein (PEP-CTERM system associated)